MAAAGLTAGVLLLVSLLAFPFFRPAPEAFETVGINPTAAEMERQLSEVARAEVKNAAVVGLVAGLLLGLTLGLVEAVSRRFERSVVPLIVCVLFGGGLGAVAGFAAQSFQNAWRLSTSLEPLTRAVIVQGVFWGIIGAAVGVGLAAFARSAKGGAFVILQAVLGGLLFVVVYVPLTMFLFPLDDSECVVPYTLGNQACWSLLACTALGAIIGLAAKRKSTSP
jgi:hypothetical protein